VLHGSDDAGTCRMRCWNVGWSGRRRWNIGLVSWFCRNDGRLDSRCWFSRVTFATMTFQRKPRRVLWPTSGALKHVYKKIIC